MTDSHDPKKSDILEYLEELIANEDKAIDALFHPAEMVKNSSTIPSSSEESKPHHSSAVKEEGINPEEMFILPLTRRPFFPGMASPVIIEPGSYYEALKQTAKTKHKSLGLFLTKEERADIYKISLNKLYHVGVLARILRILPLETGGAQVILSIEKRIEIVKQIKSQHLKAKVKYIKEGTETSSEELKAYSIAIITTIKDLLKLNPIFKEELQVFLGHSDFTEPGKLADFAASLTTSSRKELQDVLETFDIKARVIKVLMLLKKEFDLNKIQNTINQKIESSITKAQKEFFLREQLKTIKRELGVEKDDKSCELEKFEARLEKRKVPEEVMQVIREEMDKLASLEIQSAEYSVSRNYLDWLTIVPWGIYSEDALNVARAEKILTQDHYGLVDIKERILEFIGVGKLTHGVKGSILCLVGPPGVGKTSIGKSIARALNRKFYRFSVGGMRDEAEIKGHRRTYIGSMPGKFIQAVKYTQTMNPVILLDEIDKMGVSYQGDPASALLELLDPEQNQEFLDHYLDVRCDLSHVLFILTANVLETVPSPLLDRMDIMRLSGYIQEEKIQIAKKYLIPRNRKEMGLSTKDITINDAALAHIIQGYAREAGVRSLEKQIKKILRKVALKIAKAQEKNEIKSRKTSKNKEASTALVKLPIAIAPQNLSSYLGKPIFTSDRFYDKSPIGVCMGLAWTAMGGATLYVETIQVQDTKTQMTLTGQAGEVMKESAQIAWSYLQGSYREYSQLTAFFPRQKVHIHIPEGATPKDGPSAGVTMVTALLSLLLQKPVRKDLGMTGEITLTGKVLPVGGIKEKIIAAKRSKAKTLIFPQGNKRDVEELETYITKGLRLHFVDYYSQIFPLAF